MSSNAGFVWQTELGNEDYKNFPFRYFDTNDFLAPFASAPHPTSPLDVPLAAGAARLQVNGVSCPLPAQALIQNFVRSTLTLTFVIAAARVVFNIKAQMMEERRWQMELRAEVTRMRRVEAVDKLLSVLTLLVASVFGLQAIGLDGERASPL